MDLGELERREVENYKFLYESHFDFILKHISYSTKNTSELKSTKFLNKDYLENYKEKLEVFLKNEFELRELREEAFKIGRISEEFFSLMRKEGKENEEKAKRTLVFIKKLKQDEGFL